MEASSDEKRVDAEAPDLEDVPGYSQFRAAFDRSAESLDYIRKWSRTWYLLLIIGILIAVGSGIYLGWEAPVLATIPLIGATIALVIATHSLGHYGTNQAYLLSGAEMGLFLVRNHAEKERLNRELYFQETRERRRLLEGRLTEHFGPDWTEKLQRTADDPEHLAKILEPFGTELQEAKRLFPELGRIEENLGT